MPRRLKAYATNGGPFSPSPRPSPAATRVLFTARRFAGEGGTRGLRRCSVWTGSDGGSAGDPVAYVVSVHRRDSVANSFRVESYLGTMTWGSRRCAVATPGSGRNPLQALCGRGVVCATTRGWYRAVATNLQVCRSNNRNPRSDSLVDRSGGFFHAAGQRPTPRAVAMNQQVCRNRGRNKIVFVAVVCLAG